MATIDDVIAVAPSVAGGSTYAEYGGCGRKTRAAPQHGMVGPNATEAVMTWDVLYEESYLAMAAFFGSLTPVTIFGQAVTLVTPIVHPEFTDLVANSATWETLGWNDATQTEALRRITVTFRKPPYPLSGVHPYVHVQSEQGGRTEFSPSSAWQFSGGERPSVDPNRWIGGSNITMTVYHVPANFSLSNLDTYLNHTNEFAWYSYASECLRYMGARTEPNLLQIGSQTLNAALSMMSTSPNFTWNQASKADGTPALLSSDGSASGTRRYELVDFNLLFNLV
ncbi:MAG: hypothetical protein AB7G11_02770 [Phycisphaerales bacterium]